MEEHPILDNVYHQDDLFKGAIWACRYLNLLFNNFIVHIIGNAQKYSTRVEDLAAVVPNVPELPPMDLLS